jgi:hypothetical protein
MHRMHAVQHMMWMHDVHAEHPGQSEHGNAMQSMHAMQRVI